MSNAYLVMQCGCGRMYQIDLEFDKYTLRAECRQFTEDEDYDGDLEPPKLMSLTSTDKRPGGNT